MIGALRTPCRPLALAHGRAGRARGPFTPLLLLLLLLGCASAPGRDADAPPPPPPAPGRLAVRNDSEQVIFRVRFAELPADEDAVEAPAAWGPDRLAPAEVIAAGRSRGWEVPAGTYRVYVEFGDGTAIEGVDEYEVDAGEETVCVVARSEPDRPEGRLTVINTTPFAVAKVFFSLTNEITWGSERLGAGVLRPRARRTWAVPVGSYNLRAVFQDETWVETQESIVIEAGQERVFKLAADW